MYNISEKQFSRIVFILKIVIIGGAYSVIVKNVFNETGLVNFSDLNLMSSPPIYASGWLFLILGLSLLNWTIECFKWRSLVLTIKHISLPEAIKQSLASLTVSLMTPNRIGEYGAKALYYSKEHRSKILLFNFLGNFFQMVATVFFGLLGLLFVGKKLLLTNINSRIVFGMLIFMALLTLIAYLLRKRWFLYLEAIKTELQKVTIQTLAKTLTYSLLRFVVFSTQFYLLLIFFQVDLGFFIAMPLIFSMYLISSVIPSFVVFDWMIKGSVAVSLFGMYGVNELVILGVTSCMWILNFAMPSIAGSFYVMSFKRTSPAPKEDLVSR